jgi:hypothetical protein
VLCYFGHQQVRFVEFSAAGLAFKIANSLRVDSAIYRKVIYRANFKNL